MKKFNSYLFFILLFILLQISCTRIFVVNNDSKIARSDNSNGEQKPNENSHVGILFSSEIIFSVLKDRFNSYGRNVTIFFSRPDNSTASRQILAGIGSVSISQSEIKSDNALIEIKDENNVSLIKFNLTNATVFRELKIYLNDVTTDGPYNIRGHLFNRILQDQVLLSSGIVTVNINHSNGFFKATNIPRNTNNILDFPQHGIIKFESITDDVDLDVVMDSDDKKRPD